MMLRAPSVGKSLSNGSPVVRLRMNSMVVQPSASVPFQAMMSSVPPWSTSAGWGPKSPTDQASITNTSPEGVT